MNQNPDQNCWDKKKAIDQAERDYFEATDAEGKLSALSRVAWIDEHKTESPEHAIATFDDLDKCHGSRLIEAINRDKIEALEFLQTESWSWVKYAFEKQDRRWRKYTEKGGSVPHPWIDRLKVWQNQPRTIETASVDHVSNLTPVPYAVSEVNRHHWETIGSIDAVFVDGEPLASKIPSFAKGDKPVALKPKGTHGQIELTFFQPRNPGDKPIVLIAFEHFGGDLRKSIAADTAFFLWLIFASNQDLKLTDQQGAQLLARDKKGNFRRIAQTDLGRFQDVYFAITIFGKVAL